MVAYALVHAHNSTSKSRVSSSAITAVRTFSFRAITKPRKSVRNSPSIHQKQGKQRGG
jgi:hypothetical protein